MRMFEGRELKANEFVNELMWSDTWDGHAASQSAGGWGSTIQDDAATSQFGKDEKPSSTPVTQSSKVGTGEAVSLEPCRSSAS